MRTDGGQLMATAVAPDVETRVGFYRTMQECRLFEARAQELFFEGLVRGTTHLGVGQEAVAAGFAAAMNDDDYTFATYRGHNHALSRGAPMGPLYAELFGRANGLMGGKGGSMHITDVSHHMMGSYAIVGAHLPIALGAAWSAQYRKSGQVAVCFFGDGTTNIGAFHEALNMAVVWKAPVVFVCENNQYMEYTAIGAVTAVARPAADRASAYGLEPIVVDGNDAEAVFEVASRAIARARAGDGPSLVEAVTYRHGGHSRADPGKYRPDDEVESWKARDPIPAQRSRLLAAGVDEAALDAVDEEAKAKVAEAEAFARAGPEPSAKVIETQLWADGGSSWRSDGSGGGRA
jgi:acetoin:2,6-dichlorophenolindophenol oxidoreductase subunit alpha